ncbi:ABC transporter substrate-binding protein [Iocasia frigidifontis]|nr:ABC transporter substrate-binding protein [Iocasia fonsfrigidae]
MSEFKNCNLLALMPCPLKVPFERLITTYLRKKEREGVYLDCTIVANANTHLSFYEEIDNFQDIKEIPDIIISPGLNNLFYHDFYDKFIRPGYFRNPIKYDFEDNFVEIGYQDSRNNYTMFTMNLLVLVVNTARLKGARVPLKFADLLADNYYQNVAIRGRDEFICETVLLNFYKEYGLAGIKKLSYNVREGLHPSQMVKKAKSNSEEDEAIYVMPYFFARTLINHKKIEVIWPEDGALINAISMLVKKDITLEVKELARYIAGPELGNLFARAAFPVANPAVEINVYKKNKFKWLGWDFIRQNDLRKVMEEITAYYLSFQN